MTEPHTVDILVDEQTQQLFYCCSCGYTVELHEGKNELARIHENHLFVSESDD